MPSTHVLIRQLARDGVIGHDIGVDERPVSHTDVTTLMRLVADLQDDVERIRRVVEGNDEEEDDTPEADD